MREKYRRVHRLELGVFEQNSFLLTLGFDVVEVLVLQAGERVFPRVPRPTSAADEAATLLHELLVLTRVTKVHSELRGKAVEEIHL